MGNKNIKKAANDKIVHSYKEIKVRLLLGSQEEQPISTFLSDSCDLLLIVNVASTCGTTDRNYKQLVSLQNWFRESELQIFAFPCNQFGECEQKTPE